MRTIAEDVRAVGRISSVPTILEVVARTTGLRFSAVARVTDQTWTACAVRDDVNFGLKPGDGLELETTICNEIRQHGKSVVFGHASQHPQFVNHPVPKLYGFESYISVPIIQANGIFFGTLCALDPLPAKLDDPNTLRTIELFAELIAACLDTEDQLEQSKKLLVIADDTAKLREQFVAVLGHDLRNPLNSISIGMGVLEKTLVEPRELSIVKVVSRSCARIAELVDNTLDFARARLGGGIPIAPEANDRLAAVLHQVILEIQLAHSDHKINIDINLPPQTTCDNPRIAQLLGNLLANAVTHGDRTQPVDVVVKSDEHAIEISVTNGGAKIPDEILPRLFEPFNRSPDGALHEGLGLGLYIASEIARSHRGTLEVSSDAQGRTCFVFRMPRDQG